MRKYLLGALLLPSVFLLGETPWLTYSPPSQPQTQSHPPPPLMNPEITPPVATIPTNTNDIFIGIDFLWWQASISNFAYAQETRNVATGNPAQPTGATTTPDKIHEFDWNWDPGFRLTFGVNTSFDGWNFSGDWTHFYTTFDATKDLANPVENIIFEDTNPIGTKLFDLPWQPDSFKNATHVRSKGSLQLNQVDLTMGRRFWISQHLSLRPYGGFRGHFSHLDLRSKGKIQSGPNGFAFGLLQTSSHLRQELWGAGLLGGVTGRWHIIQAISLYGTGNLGLLYGRYKDRIKYKAFALNQTQTTLAMDLDYPLHHDQVFTLYSTFDLACGVRFENTWSNAKFHEGLRLLLDIGWEFHYYPSYSRFDKVIGSNGGVIGPRGNISSSTAFAPTDGNLSLMGLIVRGQFEF